MKTLLLACVCLLPVSAGVQGTSIGPLAAAAPLHRQDGGHLLGISLTEAQQGSFDDAVVTAQAAGLESTSLSLQWDDFETAPGVFGGSADQWLAIADAYYPSKGIPMVLGVNPIDTNRLRLPPDLAGLPFDDPRVVARYRALLDHVFQLAPNLELACFSIGNEIDALLGTDPAAWAQYESFFLHLLTHRSGRLWRVARTRGRPYPR